MRFRSDFTTGGPIVRLGTKWPSITSTWRRSASAATRSTSSASWAKSADRIDGAIFMASPRATAATRRPSPRSGARAKRAATIHPVGAGVVREQDRAASARLATARPAAARRRVAGARRAAQASTPVVSSAVSVHTEYTSDTARPDDAGGRARAGRVGAPRARRRSAGRMRQRGLGAPAEHAQAAARRVDQDPVERSQSGPGAPGRRRRPGGPRSSPSRSRADATRRDAARRGRRGDDQAVARPLARRSRSPCRRVRRRRRATGRPAAGRGWPRPPGWPGPAAWPAPRRPRGAAPGRRSPGRAAHRPRGPRASPRRRRHAARRRPPAGGASRGFDAQRDRRQARWRLRALARASASAELARRARSTIQSGYDSRTASAATLSPPGHGIRADAGERAQHRVHVARARLRRSDGDGLAHRGVRRGRRA